jgi:hypothetical protein
MGDGDSGGTITVCEGNIGRLISEYVDREKVLYFLHQQLANR